MRRATILLLGLVAASAAAMTALAQEVNASDFPNGVNLTSCFEEDAQAFLLPVVVVEGYGMCPVGYYCPNSYVNDSRTYPAVCPPSSECVRKRREQLSCEPQGVYEPSLCPEGRYCPTGREQYECPKGYWCPSGTREPFKCNALSHCPAGSFKERFFGVLLIVGLVDAAVVGLFVLEGWRRGQPSSLAAQASAEEGKADPAVDAASLISAALGGDATEPAHVEFTDLEVHLPENHATSPGKALLQRVSGRFEAGKVTAIMGPSGAGKTVLFTTILGKQPDDWCVQGTMTVGGGRTTMAELQPMVGFVAQDDVLRPELTVLENVLYTSEMRLPAEWDADRRGALRAAVIQALGLERVRDVPIGDAVTRGVSGGQRKRASVAMELACAPAAIFLDEPTTGLDAATALDLVRLLKTVAQAANIPIAMVIHQPRVEIWEELDQVLLLAPGGRTVYEGPVASVVPTLEGSVADQGSLSESRGRLLFDFAHGNPSDAVMDCITAHGAFLADLWESHVTQQHQSPNEPVIPADHSVKDPVHETSDRKPPTRTTAPWYKQVALAHAREVLSQVRRPQLFLYDLLLCVVGGVLLNCAAIDARFVGQLFDPYIVISPRTDIQEPTMLLMLWGIALAATFGPAGARTVGEFKTVYWREAASGHSKLAYYVGAATSTLYRTTLTVLHFTVVAYMMWQPLMSFGDLFLIIWLLALGLDGQSVLVGAIVPLNSAPLLSMILCVGAALMNGFPRIPGSIGSYAFHLTERVYAIEMEKVAHVFRTTTLESFWGYYTDRPAVNYLVWGLELAVFHVLALVFLVRLHRDKQR